MRYHSNTYAKGVYDIYWFEKNLLGDIIAVYASRGTRLIEYNYYAYIRYQGKRKRQRDNKISEPYTECNIA